jgi:hypothetical protein
MAGGSEKARLGPVSLLGLGAGLNKAGDIRARANPLDDLPGRISDRTRACHKPPIVSIGLTETEVVIKRLAGGQRSLPQGSAVLAIIGMKRGQPSPSQHRVWQLSNDLGKPLVDVVTPSIRPTCEQKIRYRLGHDAKAFLAGAQGVLVPLALGDVAADGDITANMPVVIAQGGHHFFRPELPFIFADVPPLAACGAL